MTPEAGDSPRQSGSGLPRSVLPFAGAPKGPRDPQPEDAAAHGGGAGAEDGAAFELFSAIAVSRAAEARLAALQDEGHLRLVPRRDAFREAGPVGAAYALRRASDGTGDVFAPTFRAAGALRMFGVELEEFFRGYLAGVMGPARDSGAELHHPDLARGILAPVVPLGLMVQVLGGLALGTRMLGQDRVAVVFDGDAATSTGAWHEGLVFAAARRVPMVLVVEASATDPAAARRHSRLDRFIEKAPGYGLGAAAVDGSDAVAVVDAVSEAADRARGGAGVQMVEIRYTGGDPLERLGHRLHAAGMATPEELDERQAEAARECAAAAARALASLSPGEPPHLRGVYTGSGRTERRIWADPRNTPAA